MTSCNPGPATSQLCDLGKPLVPLCLSFLIYTMADEDDDDTGGKVSSTLWAGPPAQSLLKLACMCAGPAAVLPTAVKGH